MERAEERIRALGLSPAVANQVIAALSQSTDTLVARVQSSLLGACLAIAGDPDLLRTALPALLDAAEGDQRGTLARGIAQHMHALIAWRSVGDLLAATEHLNHSLDVLESLSGDIETAYAGRVHDTLGQLLHHQGLLLDARLAFERALALKQRGGDHAGIALTQGNLGRLCMALGDFGAAAGHLRDDLAYVQATAPEATRLRSTLGTQIASCAIGVDDVDGARTLLEQARALSDEAGDPIGAAFARLHLARAALRGGDIVAAQDHLAAIGAVDVSAIPELQGLAAQVQAQLDRAQDDLGSALEHFEEARACYRRASRVTPVEQAELLEAFACAAEDDGQHHMAADLLREALRDLDATTAESMRQRLDDHLRRLDRHAWMLHSTGRFVGHKRIDALLGEAGRGGFRGRKAEAAVLFSDLRGFTAFAESLDADTLVSVLNRYFGHMTRCVEHYGGRIDKFIGDAVMAIFLPDDEQAHHGARAARAALFMQAELARFNRFLPEGVSPLAAGIGVNAGPLVAGIIGSPQKRSFTVLGDTVNTASRLEGMSKLLNAPVLVSGAVASVLDEALRPRLLPLGRYRPHGRLGAVEVHAVGEPVPDTVRDEARAALRLFQDRAFGEAARALDALSASRRGQTGDKGYALHAATAAQFATTPPPPDWDGAVVLTEK